MFLNEFVEYFPKQSVGGLLKESLEVFLKKFMKEVYKKILNKSLHLIESLKEFLGKFSNFYKSLCRNIEAIHSCFAKRIIPEVSEEILKKFGMDSLQDYL